MINIPYHSKENEIIDWETGYCTANNYETANRLLNQITEKVDGVQVKELKTI
jgi:hypothetical protein